MAAAQGMSLGMSQGLFLPCQQHQSEFLGEAAGLGCQGGAVNETPQELLPFLLPELPAGRESQSRGQGARKVGCKQTCPGRDLGGF